MQTINIVDSIFSLVLVAGFISIFKFISSEKKAKNVSYADILIAMINTFKYKKNVLVNDYPEYHGELEKNDTNEFIDFLDTGILNKFESNRNEK